MKKSDIPNKDREMCERMQLCPYCHHALRDDTKTCDRWACWVTRTDTTLPEGLEP